MFVLLIEPRPDLIGTGFLFYEKEWLQAVTPTYICDSN